MLDWNKGFLYECVSGRKTRTITFCLRHYLFLRVKCVYLLLKYSYLYTCPINTVLRLQNTKKEPLL